MTIAVTSTKVQHEGNDSTTEFSFDFYVDSSSELTVILTETDGTDTELTETTDYTVSGTQQENGGTVTYPVSGDPLATGETLTIYRTTALTQDTDLTNQGPYFASTVELALDRIVRQVQELDERLDRANLTSITGDDAEDALTQTDADLRYVRLSSNNIPYYGASQPTGSGCKIFMDNSSKAVSFYNGSTWIGLGTANEAGMGLLQKAGGTMSGAINMNSQSLYGLPVASADTQPIRRDTFLAHVHDLVDLTATSLTRGMVAAADGSDAAQAIHLFRWGLETTPLSLTTSYQEASRVTITHPSTSTKVIVVCFAYCDGVGTQNVAVKVVRDPDGTPADVAELTAANTFHQTYHNGGPVIFACESTGITTAQTYAFQVKTTSADTGTAAAMAIFAFSDG